MKVRKSIAALAAIVGLIATGTVAKAADEYSVSLSPRSENINANSEIAVTPNNLPAGVGIYAILCLDVVVDGDMATDAAARPTICDQTQSKWIVRPDSSWATTPGVSVSTANLIAKATFDGKASRMATEITPVDCRIDDCVVYIRPDHVSTANTFLYEKFDVTLLPDTGLGLTDFATFSVEEKSVEYGSNPTLTYADTVTVTTETDSELEVTLTAIDNNCAVVGNQVKALYGEGNCLVRATTLGNETYDPLAQSLTFKLRKVKQLLLVIWPTRFNHQVGDSVVIQKSDFKSNVKSARNLKSKTPAICSVVEAGNEFTLSFKRAGICKVEATSAYIEGKFQAARVVKTFGVRK